DRMYSVTKNVQEEVTISIEDGTGISMHVIYYSNHIEERLTGDLNGFKKRLGYDDDVEKQRGDNQLICSGHYERNGFRTYVGYALNDEGMGGVELTYKIDCRDKNEEICKENKQSDKDRAMKWMESVQFINEDEGEDHE